MAPAYGAVPPPPPTLQMARARAPQARAAVATAPARTRRSTAPARPRRRSAEPRTRGPQRKATVRKPAARSASRRRSQATPPRGQLIPIAVGRTAVAVRGLPDSGLVVRMTRGRMWIGVLGALLAGIVALNVISLSLSSSSSRVSQQATALGQSNSALRAKLAEQLSNDRVEAAAARLGLVVPAPGDITYLTLRPGDAGTAADRFASGGFTGPTLLVGTATPAPAAPAPQQAPAPAPAPTPTEPAPATSPAQSAPPATQQASPAPAQPASGGGATGGSGGGTAGGVSAG